MSRIDMAPGTIHAGKYNTIFFASSCISALRMPQTVLHLSLLQKNTNRKYYNHSKHARGQPAARKRLVQGNLRGSACAYKASHDA